MDAVCVGIQWVTAAYIVIVAVWALYAVWNGVRHETKMSQEKEEHLTK